MALPSISGAAMPQHASAPIGFDSEEDAESVRRRGVSLAFGAVASAYRVGEVEDARRDYGETRMEAFGLVEGVLFACTFTMRGGAHRILSVHRVREREAERWLEGR